MYNFENFKASGYTFTCCIKCGALGQNCKFNLTPTDDSSFVLNWDSYVDIPVIEIFSVIKEIFSRSNITTIYIFDKNGTAFKKTEENNAEDYKTQYLYNTKLSYSFDENQ